jgi:hypothetical protein
MAKLLTSTTTGSFNGPRARLVTAVATYTAVDSTKRMLAMPEGALIFDLSKLRARGVLA